MASPLGPRTSANDTSAGGGKHSDDDRRPGTHPVPPMSCWHAPAMRRDITGPRQQHGSTTGAGFSECFGTVLDPSSRVLMFVSIFLIKVPAWVYWRCGSCPSSSWRSSGLFSTRQPGVAFFAHVGRVHLRLARGRRRCGCGSPPAIQALHHQRGSHQDGHRGGVPHPAPVSVDQTADQSPYPVPAGGFTVKRW
jgi:hypothetical protein